jgi:hypothetical protein
MNYWVKPAPLTPPSPILTPERSEVPPLRPSPPRLRALDIFGPGPVTHLAATLLVQV